MSLLLDALKKAADDKKKNLGKNSTPDDAAELDESLELELDTEAQTIEIDDEFPDVSESPVVSAKPNKPEVKKPADKKTEPDTSSNTNDDAILEPKAEKAKPVAETPALQADQASEAAVEIKLIKDATPEKTVQEKTPVTEQPKIIKVDEISAANNKLTKKLETEQALSALINKSNLHSRREHLKRTITISILAALLVIGSALYFYIQMTTESQEIFITDNNQAIINRGIEDTTQSIAISTPLVTQEKNVTVQKKPIAAKQKTVSNINNSARNASGISIEHTQKADPVNALILEAYNEFYRDNYSQAEKLYNQVVLREPNNRDALLGLSAIAIKQQRYADAQKNYHHLLKLNPRDSIAIAGLSSIQSSINAQLDESQIKFLLKQNPDAAHLHFALGSIYSSQSKWPEAQSSYFSAWSVDNKNADFAYNLAVSLDHLDKKNQAIEYYLLSLQLKQASSGNFNSDTTSARINILRENR